ncbi:tryptophan--tRNA ligase [Neisseriaceae bacterium PsAf]|nr:tryptophan--tRNA ligase [Neisseriaceae bacterium PsAf]
MKQRILTGVTTTGTPHLGNYVGAIRPAILASQNSEVDSFFFLANYHGLIKCKDPELIHQSILSVAATWLAAGLDYEKVTFYRQSDIIEVPELNWILTTCCAKGLMNRAHAYKAAVQENLDKGINDVDHGIEMGLYCYPVLMAADILAFNANLVPVGKDQIQHLEMARDIAARFNHRYQPIFNLPEVLIDEDTPLLSGLDGRKMSKSYGNTIPLFENEKKLRKIIMKIVTNSLEPGEPKATDDSSLYEIYAAFATEDERKAFENALKDGIAWGEAKQVLFQKLNDVLAPMREKYEYLIAYPNEIEEILQYGAQKARKVTAPLLQEIKSAVGIRILK